MVPNLTAAWPIILTSVKTYFEWQFSVFNQFKKIKSLYVRLLKLSSKSAWSISRWISCSAETLYSIFDCFPIRNIRLPSFHTQFFWTLISVPRQGQAKFKPKNREKTSLDRVVLYSVCITPRFTYRSSSFPFFWHWFYCLHGSISILKSDPKNNLTVARHFVRVIVARYSAYF